MSKEAVITARTSIREALKPLFERAKAEGLWFFCSYQGLWFSPEQLQKEQEQQRFLWGPKNWQLRDPKEYLEEAQRRLDAAQQAFKDAEARVAA